MPLQIVATDSVSGRTLSYAASGLPPGLGIAPSTGLITGTPTTAGSYDPLVTVTDNVGISGATTFPWSVTTSPQGKKSTVGASCFTQIYGTDWTSRTNTFDTNVGRPIGKQSWKVYFQNVSQYPVTINNPQPIGTAAAAGAKALISVMPAIDPSNNYTTSTYTAEAAKIASMCQLLNTNSVSYDIIFYNEMNKPALGFTVSSWLAFWQFYAPVVHANGGTVSWCPAINNTYSNAIPLFPVSPYPDKIHFDWYSNDQILHGITPITYGLSALADAHNIPLGIGEFGPTNDGKKFKPNAAQWTTFCTDQMIGIFGSTPTPSYPSGGRLAAGKANADIIYYSEPNTPGAAGAIMSPSDFKVPGLQAVYDALNA